jgi:hypothetical protein
MLTVLARLKLKKITRILNFIVNCYYTHPVTQRRDQIKCIFTQLEVAKCYLPPKAVAKALLEETLYRVHTRGGGTV